MLISILSKENIHLEKRDFLFHSKTFFFLPEYVQANLAIVTKEIELQILKSDLVCFFGTEFHISIEKKNKYTGYLVYDLLQKFMKVPGHKQKSLFDMN